MLSWVKLLAMGIGLAAGVVGMGLTYYYAGRDLQLEAEQRRNRTGGVRGEINRKRCRICLTEIVGTEEVTLPCGHTFCWKCLKPLLSGTQTTCCVCRKEMSPDLITFLKNQSRINYLED